MSRFLHCCWALVATAALMSLLVTLPASAQDVVQDKFKAVTTFTVIADMAQNVAGDAAAVESITRPGAEIHNYAPTPRDILRAQDADMILWNGLDLERWFERFFHNLEDVPSVVVSKGIEPISITTGPYDGKPNPHVDVAGERVDLRRQNPRCVRRARSCQCRGLQAECRGLQAEDRGGCRAPPRSSGADPDEDRWLVTSEGAFSYLARDFGLRERYLWPINADQQGTPQQVREVIDTIRANDIPAIFSESTVSDKPARQVARETGIHYGGVLYVDSLSESDGPVPTYIDLLRVTSETIVKGLTQGASS